jgi:TATA-box binding protein (TBP) (component of TFIID and TFIIIB)
MWIHKIDQPAPLSDTPNSSYKMSGVVEYTTPILTISPVRISTMVTTAHVGCIINLDRLWAQVQILPYWDLNNGILEMDYQGTLKGTSWKRILQKDTKPKKTFFFNQATLVIRREVAPLNWKEINIKLFRNGGVQMTGVRSEEMSWSALRWIIDHIQTQCIEPVFESEVVLNKMQPQLVNTDFSIGAKIRRDILYKILSEQYHLTVSYEPSIYQGVKTKYFYNAQRPEGCPAGVCPCEKLCKGTGDGSKLGECKKITISPFQTGQIIITGARTMAQILEAYEFMKALFQTHAEEVLRKNYICPGGEAAPVAKKTVGWIQHPSPRNLFKVSTHLLVGV